MNREKDRETDRREKAIAGIWGERGLEIINLDKEKVIPPSL